jgi:hypothetical protein
VPRSTRNTSAITTMAVSACRKADTKDSMMPRLSATSLASM